MLRSVLAATGLLLCASPALADASDDEGRACVTSDDCGDAHCIDGTCVVVEGGRVRKPPKPVVSVGTSAMFGDGSGYVTTIIVADVVATTATGVLVALAFLTGSAGAGFAIASLVPTTLTGPIVHLAFGRPIPAIVSFFAWASVPPSAVSLGVLVGLGSGFDGTAAAVAGTAVGVAGAIGLTALDAYFARPVRLRDERVEWMPIVTPLPGGGLAGVGGVF